MASDNLPHSLYECLRNSLQNNIINSGN